MSEHDVTERLDHELPDADAPRTKRDLDQPAPASTRRRPRRATVILAGLLAAAFVIAVTLGVILSDTQSQLTLSRQETSALSSEASELETRLEQMTTSRDQYRDNAARVAEREIEVSRLEQEVDEREATVAEREAAVAVEEERVAATTLLDGYAYTVGQTMEAGTYEANATGSTCYWKITVSGSNYSNIVDNDLGTRGVIRVTVSAGQDFQSQRCGDWRKVG